MSNGIGREEVGLFSIIALAGLIGFTVHSCNKASMVNNDIEERKHEFDIKNPAPCKNHSAYIDVSEGSHGTCAPGETPEYKDIGVVATGRRVWLFCTCPVEKEKVGQLIQPDRSPQKPDEIYADYLRRFYGMAPGTPSNFLPAGQ